MEWERAKTYILIAFVMLNLGLAFLLVRENRQFTLTGDRVSNIREVLSNNNIILYNIQMRRFAPMRHLDVTGYYYNVDELLNIFFGENEFFQIETETNHFRYETEGDAFGSLEISNGFIFFDNRAALGENEFAEISRTEAIAIAYEFIENHFSDFVRDSVFDEFNGNGVHVIFREEYRGQLIHSNEIELLVTAGGIAWIEMRFGRVIGYSAEPRAIFAPDEILLTFMQRVWHEAEENPIFISNIEIVYFQEYASDQVGSVYPAVPYYRIFIQGRDLPFLINAYTNTLFE
jgi:hypothetical protein